MNLRKLCSGIFFLMCICGCSNKSVLGVLELAEQSSTSLYFRVESSVWPSRWVYFEPTEVAGMRAYSEAIHRSIVDLKLTNSGSSACTVRYLKDEWRLAPRDAVSIAGVKFAELRLVIAPEHNNSADMTMELSFDRKYTTVGSWRFVGAWADGP